MSEFEDLSSTKDIGPPDEESDPSFSLLHPTKIGRYTILRRLGRGGFGEVFLAFDDDLDRPVAIKVPRPERVSQPEDIEVYLNEARILANLDHPHIVAVYDVGRTDDGLCFVVSKFIEGSDLAKRIKESRPGFQESAEVVAAVADALHYAHTHGLVHRDVKPGNILTDASGKAFVTDFGLALKEEDFGKGGGLAGTPSYMSPEQARREGHRVDGRSDIFSLGVVFYVLLTGQKPFVAKAQDKDEARNELLDLIATTDARPPRMIDDGIPKELERICLKAMSKRATDRFNTARDMADDLKEFLKTAGRVASPLAQVVIIDTASGSTQEERPVPSTSKQSDSDQQPLRIVPKGLRSFDEHDADFFLELLPGPRDRYGLPESIRFWKTRIEQTDQDKTFNVGLIYGPSGCGKSSLVKAGLLPRLGKHVLPVYVEATPEQTEARLLKGLRKACPELPQGMGLVDSLARLRRGGIWPPERKVLLVLDQFEQWLHAKRGEENTELVTALRQCDGEHLQAVVMVGDDFWLAVTRIMDELEIELLKGHNTLLVDLFDLRHARKVLTAFGTAYGNLPERMGDISRDQHAFLNQAVGELSQNGKVISVRLALFAEMMVGKPWTSVALRKVGGTEGLGVTFLEETFSSPQANPKHRFHQKAAQAVLRGLLPETGTDIKGQMRSRQELLVASGYASRPSDFNDLIRILDSMLRLVTPTDPEGSLNEKQQFGSSEQYYQLTHDYLVHSLREWLTRKQRETKRGRAELRLAERSGFWNAKPQNRLLPSALEWANIRLMTRKKDWTEPQRKMMKRAGWVHGSRTITALVLLGLLTWCAIEWYGNLRASALVDKLAVAGTSEVPSIIGQLSSYRHWANRHLKTLVLSRDDTSLEKLHASLALLPVDASQLPFLEKRLLGASPTELMVIRDALNPHRATLVPKLWTTLDSAQPDDVSLLPAASALADYDPTNERWESVGGKVAQALIRVNPVLLGPWLGALRPMRSPITTPVAAIHRNAANLLLDADPKAYAACFAIAQYNEPVALPLFRAEIDRKLEISWNDPPLDSSWTPPDATLKGKIEAAKGMLTERFAFCQTMPMDGFLTTAEAFRKSGYRPIRFRPYADGKSLRVAAVWTRDGRNWRLAHGRSIEEIRLTDERNRKEGYVPVEAAGYLATDRNEGKLTSRFASLWAQRTAPDDDARIIVVPSIVELNRVQGQMKNTGLVPLTLHAWRQADNQLSYSGVWHKMATGTPGTPFSQSGLSESVLPELVVQQSSLIDLDLAAAPPPLSTKERAASLLRAAEASLRADPNDLSSRLTQASAHIDLGESQKAIDDLDVVIKKSQQEMQAYQLRAIAHARLGHKDQAKADLEKREKFEIGTRIDSQKLYLAVIVAAELGDGTDTALEALEAALKKRPQNSDLHYHAARAYALASQALAKKDQAKGTELAERAIRLLGTAIENGYTDYQHMQDDADLDPLRELPAFAEILKAGHLDRSYTAVWSGDLLSEASPLLGLDPTSHLQRCRALVSQGYRMVSLSVARTSSDGEPVTTSVWRCPVITEETRDQLAKRQARAAIALLRIGKAAEFMPLLRHSADPRIRSFIVNWLNPLGADPKTIAAELDRLLPTSEPTPAEGQQFMDAVLFHPETSQRRALILALGTYGTEILSPGGREPLISKILNLYRTDPDAGIHGAIAWTLRQWKQQERLKEVDAQLMNQKDRGERRWFVNSQGQTFAVIEGPVEFLMGSPPAEPGRFPFPGEDTHHQIIPRRFAIAAQEVSVKQYQLFVKENPGLDHAKNDKHSPDPEGPMNNISWYDAAAYCNWLSRQDGLPECYDPNVSGKYADGMKIKSDALRLRGYRLPTEAEWEYACRAGALTSRYYGATVDLLGRYAWYNSTSLGHAQPCGRLLPNEFGLFDMLGNVWERCHDVSLPHPNEIITDDVYIYLHEVANTPRFLRGGTFLYQEANVRSASRTGLPPALRVSDYGFRPSRTYP
jgi:serine/threonine protein kinase/formylglycine-generating enzyme required for sulfatase activity/tetratricopeptide (TPR) repeat protein